MSVGPLIVPATESFTSAASAAGVIAHSPMDFPLAFMRAMTSPMNKLQSTFAAFLSSPFAAASYQSAFSLCCERTSASYSAMPYSSTMRARLASGFSGRSLRHSSIVASSSSTGTRSGSGK